MTSTTSGTVVGKPGRFRRAWSLAKLNWRVLMLDKELIVFPLLSGISCLVVLAGFAGGIWASGAGQQQEQPIDEIVATAVLFAWYFLNYFVIVFFNSALVACAIIRFKGGDPTVGDGLRAAGGCLPQILAWALLAATVGVLLRMIEKRAEFVVRIVAALLGAAWTIATYLVVPVLVIEKLGPIQAFKRSAAMIRATWGELLVTNVGIGAIASLLAVLILIGGAVGIVMLYVQLHSIPVVVTGILVIVLLLILISLVSSALDSIILGALYLYASGKRLPEALQAAGVQDAFVTRMVRP